MTERMLLVYGDPVDGFTFVGPVTPNDPELDRYVDTELRNVTWFYVPLRTLDEVARSASSPDHHFPPEKETALAALNNEQDRIKQLAENLLATLDAVVPNSTIHHAVEDTRRSLAELIRKVDTIKTGEPKTWTFFGHWVGSKIVVEYYYPGDIQDDRIDHGEYPEGLWAGAASGATVEEASAAAVAEYENPFGDDLDEDDEHDHSRAKEDARNAHLT